MSAYQYDPDCYQSDEPAYDKLPSYRAETTNKALLAEQSAHEETKEKLFAWQVYAAVIALCLIGQSINIYLGVV